MVTTITTTAGEDARMAVAFGAKLGLTGNANAAQIKADVIAYVRQVVISYERDVAFQAFTPAALSPT